MNESESPAGGDHRSRVAAERRARTRDQLIRAGLRLAAERGALRFTIDDVVGAADMARGTFYKYYQTTDQLVRDVALELAEELIVTVNGLVAPLTDPAWRSSHGLRAVLHLARMAPLAGAFITRAGWPHGEPGHAFFRLVAPNLQDGMAQGRFRLARVEIGLILVGGMTVGAMQAMEAAKLPDDFPEEMAETLLVALGLDRAEAALVSRSPLILPPLRPDGLIAHCLG